MSDPLLSLAPSELRALASGLRSGRLSSPFASAGVQKFVSIVEADRVAKRLSALEDSGSTISGVAETLDILANAIEGRPAIEDLVELVHEFIKAQPPREAVERRNLALPKFLRVGVVPNRSVADMAYGLHNVLPLLARAAPPLSLAASPHRGCPQAAANTQTGSGLPHRSNRVGGRHVGAALVQALEKHLAADAATLRCGLICLLP